MAGETGRFPLIRTKMQRIQLPTSQAVDHESIRREQRHQRTDSLWARAARLCPASRRPGWPVALANVTVTGRVEDVVRFGRDRPRSFC